MSGFQFRGIRPCIRKCLFAFLMLNGMIYVDKKRTKKILEFQIGIKPATPSMTYPWAIGNFTSTRRAKRQCYIAPSFFFFMCLVFIRQKHTYISVKEGIKYKRTFILWHVSLHMTGAFCKWVCMYILYIMYLCTKRSWKKVGHPSVLRASVDEA